MNPREANGDNAILVSISMLSDELNLAMVRIIVEAGKETERWHSAQNRALRSSGESQAWLTEQVSGSFYKHVVGTLQKLESAAALERCRIATPLPGASVSEHSDGNCEVTREDHLSALLGKCTVCLATKRMVRSLWAIRGYPFSMAAILGDGRARDFALGRFQQDIAAYKEFERAAERTAVVTRLLDRCIFKHVPVQQLQQA